MGNIIILNKEYAEKIDSANRIAQFHVSNSKTETRGLRRQRD